MFKSFLTQNVKNRLQEFYETCEDYEAFNKSFTYPKLYDFINQLNPSSVLEVGAGVSLAAKHLEVEEYTAFDITDRNILHFKSLGVNLKTQEGELALYDIIFSTYVFEHVADPEKFIEFYLSRLNKNGKLIILSPSYDMPGYVPPSVRHNNAFTNCKKLLNFWLGTWLATSKVYFCLNDDPACFHKPWKRDYDAIHIVSKRRVKRYCNYKGLKYEEIDVYRDVIHRLTSMAVQITKTN